MPKGLATRIHKANTLQALISSSNSIKVDDISSAGESEEFFIKGPMGRGLQLDREGVHVAFCAGTGALVFIDLVSQLIISNAFQADGKDLPEEMKRFYGKGFEFHLYCSF